MELAEKLPYFTLDDLSAIEKDKNYLKVLLSRYAKAGKVVRLKKGMYVAKNYIDVIEKNGAIANYGEFLAMVLCEPAYLSLEYVLSENNMLTEAPHNYTLVSLSKTNSFSNRFGNFFYHKIRRELFLGYDIINTSNYLINKATKAKALFDFLYFRKNHLSNENSVAELRLNLDALSAKDIAEFKKYIALDGSKKMKTLSKYLF